MFETFYGLKSKPFQLTPDPAFYFESLTHRKALSYLGYGLSQGEGFIVITGEVGAGKSTLAAHLMASVDPAQLTVGQIVTSRLDEDEVIHVVAQCFGVGGASHDKALTLGSIEAFLHEEAREGRRCLLVVDEAQNLSIAALEELRMLSNFQLGSHPLLQIFLLGQPEFRTTLQTNPGLEQLRQRVIAAHHLEAMEPDEIKAYVEHRLTLAGWVDDPSFDPAIFTTLYEASAGIPRKLNTIMGRLLLLGAVEQKHHIDPPMLANILAELAATQAVSDDGGPEHDAADHAVPHHDAMQAEETLQVASHTGPAEPAAALRAGEAPPAATLDPQLVEDLLQERDAQIAELQQAVIELADKQEEDDPRMMALLQRLSTLEDQMKEQERAVRHTLTMLIEWVESGCVKPLAA